jgi:hypothetical protein
MSWFRQQLDELKLLLFMMAGVSPPKDLQERMGLRQAKPRLGEKQDEKQSEKKDDKP